MYLWTPKPNRNHQKTNIYVTLRYPPGGDIPPFGSLPYIYMSRKATLVPLNRPFAHPIGLYIIYIDNFITKHFENILRQDSESSDHVLYESLNYLSESLN